MRLTALSLMIALKAAQTQTTSQRWCLVPAGCQCHVAESLRLDAVVAGRAVSPAVVAVCQVLLAAAASSVAAETLMTAMVSAAPVVSLQMAAVSLPEVLLQWPAVVAN